MNPFLGVSASSTETSNTASSLSLSPQTPPPRWITSTYAPPPLSGLLLPPPAFTRGPQALSYPHDRPPLPPLFFAPHQTAPAHLTHESLMATAAAHLYQRHSDHFDHQLSPQLRPQLPFAVPPTRSPHPQPLPLTNSPNAVTAGAAPPRPQEASTPQHKVMLQIGVQPPNRTVYQRLLKPYPSVYLIAPPLPSTGAAFPGDESGEALRQLHWTLREGEGISVEASVVRNDNGDTLERSIDGVTSVRLEKSDWHSGVYTATFRKLKLLTTSQQRSGTKFSLCFRLACSELALGSLAHLSVTSSPIEVFSHSLYLSQAEEDGIGKREPSSPKNATARKYGNNCAGLQLKIMEMIHGFRELGGTEQAMHESVSAMFSPHGDSALPLFNSSAAATSPSAQASAPPPAASESTPSPPVSSTSLQHLLNPTSTHPHPRLYHHHDHLGNAWIVHTALATASGSSPSSAELRRQASAQAIDEEHRSKRARRRNYAAGSPEATASDPAPSYPPQASRLPSIASLLDDTRPISNPPAGPGKWDFCQLHHQGRSLEVEGEEEEGEEGEEEQKDRVARHRRRRRRHNKKSRNSGNQPPCDREM